MLKHLTDLAEAWEYLVQDAWASTVLSVAEAYGTPAETQVRVCRAGWRALIVVTWPATLLRWIEWRAEGTGPA